MVFQDDFHRPVRPQHEQARGSSAAGQRGEQVERRVITPVQVLQQEDKRRVNAQRFQEIGQLAQHPLVGDIKGSRRLSGTAILAKQRGPPARGMTFQHGPEHDWPQALFRAAQRLQHGEVWFAAAVVFKTLAQGERNSPPPDAGLEHVEQGGLAAPRLPREEHHVAPPRQGLVQVVLQFAQLGGAADQDGDDLRQRDRRFRGGGPGPVGLRGGSCGPHPGHEPVAAAMGRLDEPGALWVIPKGFADFADADFQRGVRDQRVGPDGAEDLLLDHKLSRSVGEIPKNSQSLWREGHYLSAAPQVTADRIESVGAEQEFARRTHDALLLMAPRGTHSNLRDGLGQRNKRGNRKGAFCDRNAMVSRSVRRAWVRVPILDRRTTGHDRNPDLRRPKCLRCRAETARMPHAGRFVAALGQRGSGVACGRSGSLTKQTAKRPASLTRKVASVKSEHLDGGSHDFRVRMRMAATASSVFADWLAPVGGQKSEDNG